MRNRGDAYGNSFFLLLDSTSFILHIPRIETLPRIFLVLLRQPIAPMEPDGAILARGLSMDELKA